jgi:hypothetical protein
MAVLTFDQRSWTPHELTTGNSLQIINSQKATPLRNAGEWTQGQDGQQVGEQPAVSSPRCNLALTSIAIVKMIYRLASSSGSTEPVSCREERVMAGGEDVVDTQTETNFSRVFQASFSFLTHTTRNHRTPYPAIHSPHLPVVRCTSSKCNSISFSSSKCLY